jgi:hypothetical protein
LVSAFRSFFGDPVSTAYTVVFLLLSDVGLVLGDARVEMDREFAEGKKQHSEVLVIDAFSSDAAPMYLIVC